MTAPASLGKYTLLDRISAGGMAEVFRARMQGAEGFQRLVAVKRILPHMAEDPLFVQSLVEEAKLTVLLNHACIAQTLDLGRDSDTLYLAMEYVSGQDLRTVVGRLVDGGKRAPVPMTCYVMAALADALDYAHAKCDADGNPLHIVHRDISPSNTMLSYEGDVKLIDFGIARAATRASLTRTGTVKGKLAYMSPEQANGKKIDHRTDIYAAGIMLWELLTGTRLFDADSEPQLYVKVMEGRISRPTEVNPSLPVGLEEITLRALARVPEERYQRAGELADALRLHLLSSGQRFGREELSALMRSLFPKERAAEQERVRKSAAMSAPPPPPPAEDRTVILAAAPAPTPEMTVVMTPAAPAPAPDMTVVVTPPGPEAPPQASPEPRTAPPRPKASPRSRPPPRPKAPPPMGKAEGRRIGPVLAMATLAAGVGAVVLFLLLPPRRPAQPMSLPPLPPPAVVAEPAPEPAPPPPPKPAVAARGTGFLQLASHPPGKVWIDGQPLGKTTPLVRHPLPAGKHVIGVRVGPKQLKEETVEIRTGETASIFLTVGER